MTISAMISAAAMKEVLKHPILAASIVVGVFSLVGSTVGATLLPFALKDEVPTKAEVAQLHSSMQREIMAQVNTMNTDVAQIKITLCEAAKQASVGQLDQRLERSASEQWDIEGLIQTSRGSERDRGRLGLLKEQYRQLERQRQELVDRPCR